MTVSTRRSRRRQLQISDSLLATLLFAVASVLRVPSSEVVGETTSDSTVRVLVYSGTLTAESIVAEVEDHSFADKLQQAGVGVSVSIFGPVSINRAVEKPSSLDQEPAMHDAESSLNIDEGDGGSGGLVALVVAGCAMAVLAACLVTWCRYRSHSARHPKVETFHQPRSLRTWSCSLKSENRMERRDTGLADFTSTSIASANLKPSSVGVVPSEGDAIRRQSLSLKDDDLEVQDLDELSSAGIISQVTMHSINSEAPTTNACQGTSTTPTILTPPRAADIIRATNTLPAAPEVAAPQAAPQVMASLLLSPESVEAAPRPQSPAMRLLNGLLTGPIPFSTSSATPLGIAASPSESPNGGHSGSTLPAAGEYAASPVGSLRSPAPRCTSRKARRAIDCRELPRAPLQRENPAFVASLETITSSPDPNTELDRPATPISARMAAPSVSTSAATANMSSSLVNSLQVEEIEPSPVRNQVLEAGQHAEDEEDEELAKALALAAERSEPAATWTPRCNLSAANEADKSSAPRPSTASAAVAPGWSEHGLSSAKDTTHRSVATRPSTSQAQQRRGSMSISGLLEEGHKGSILTQVQSASVPAGSWAACTQAPPTQLTAVGSTVRCPEPDAAEAQRQVAHSVIPPSSSAPIGTERLWTNALSAQHRQQRVKQQREQMEHDQGERVWLSRAAQLAARRWQPALAEGSSASGLDHWPAPQPHPLSLLSLAPASDSTTAVSHPTTMSRPREMVPRRARRPRCGTLSSSNVDRPFASVDDIDATATPLRPGVDCGTSLSTAAAACPAPVDAEERELFTRTSANKTSTISGMQSTHLNTAWM